MEVFEITQEIEVLHGAFLSSQRTLAMNKSCSNLCQLSDSDKVLVVTNISKSVKFAISSFRKTAKSQPRCEVKKILRRIHAAIFYKVLVSSRIDSPKAEEYFEVLESYLLELDWEMYLQIIMAANLTEYFVECVMQLPDDISVTLLQWTLQNLKANSAFFPHLLNPLLHLLKHKVFHFKCSEALSESKFDFDFTLSKEDTQHYSFSAISSELLSYMVDAIEDVRLTNILLDWLVSIVDYLCETNDNVTSMTAYFDFVESFFHSEDIQNFLEKSLKSFSFRCFQQSLLVNDGSNAHPGYSLYLLFAKWQHLYRKLCSESKTMSDIMKKLKDIVDSLYVYHPLQLRNDYVNVEVEVKEESSPEILEEYFKMLVFIVDEKLDGLDYTTEMLLWDTKLRRKDNVLDCVTRNVHLYTENFSNMQLLMDTAVDESGPQKKKLVDIFMNAYSELPMFTQSKLMQSFLLVYGSSTVFKLPSYEIDLLTFFNRSVDQNQMNQLTFPLFIQSPEGTVDRIIRYILQVGPSVMSTVHALSNAYFVCGYQGGKKHAPTVLITCLSHHFRNDNLDKVQKDCLLLLTKKLIEVFYDTHVLHIDELLLQCILYNLDVSTPIPELIYKLQLLDACFIESNSRETASWVVNFDIVPLLALFCSLLSSAIVKRDGYLKEIVLCSLSHVTKFLTKHSPLEPTEHNIEWLQYELMTMHPVVQFYISKFVPPPNIEKPLMDLSVYICCILINGEDETAIVLNEDCAELLKDLDYCTLLSALIKIIPHFTSDEFYRLYDFLYQLKPLEALTDNVEKFIQDGKKSPHYYKKLKLLQFVTLIVNVLIALHCVDDVDFCWPYMISSFLNVLKNNLSEVNLDVLGSTKMFLEICRLSENFPDCVDMFIVLLQDILSKQNSLEMKLSLAYRKCFLTAAEKLPDCDTKLHLIEMLV